MRSLLARVRRGLAYEGREDSPDPAEARAEEQKPPEFDLTPYLAEIELVERFSRDWDANAGAYREALGKLRDAARRLLPICDQHERLRRIADEISCLARQPLYFPEMYHAVTLLPDGTFKPLDEEDAKHRRQSGLLGPNDRTAITEIYQRLAKSGAPLRVVEIGSAIGRGSTRIAGKFVKDSGGLLYCVDPWEGDWYFSFLANLRVLDLENTVVPIRSFSAEAAVLFDDGSLDAVFVDGSHLYPYVLADIDAYLPKIRKGGIMFGHDIHDVPSRFDRNELLAVTDVNNTVVNYTNAQGEVERVDVHPGVILAVQDRFGDDVELFPGSVVWAKQF